MINLEYLAAFVAAAEKGSFSAAGRHIGKSQSTVSVSINNLELDLGITLFDRSGKYPVLTSEGEHLYQQAKVLMRQAERIQHYSSEVRDEVENHITIGIDPLVPFALIETALEKFARKYPFTQVQIVKEKHDQLFEKLGNDELDFALNMAAQAIPEYFEFACVLQVAWICVCSPDSEFADLEVVNNDLLTTERQIHCTSMHEHPILGPVSTLSQSVWLVHDQDDMIRMVEQDIGWAILPKVMLEERVALGTLVEFKPDYMKADQYYGVDLLWKDGAKLGPACKYFRELLFVE
ncbi:LysR family transcriptional regulator [Vibrio tubiashii]|uniref:LysR family transcriptional regulator n=1 Tax=Vibrio tubiashii ATCC 19109 TaxID=1051646 RepID=F9T6E6_9VIBR|nr:LysR family transcriptional regulator [Vibrio tubiashii]AIW16701.1 LysR family transcriptional regulator [Vibrio tubiashii ATCC 19109]EGU54609.1 regulatory protein, LysR:LysR substrate-binding [Vibrio tubiashii ATCC 19109]EIF02047.1 regulatory protein LysR:LysR substrate-binding [Vibrio tubiashii NCIMB 1337 = ATCC 19106]